MNYFVALYKFTQYLLMFLGLIVIQLHGLFIIPLGIPFRRELGDKSQYTQYPNLGNWQLVRLPDWKILKWYDNTVDGMLGDKRGYWANYSKSWNKYLAMYFWLAIRNPANYLKRFIITCDVSKVVTSVVHGQDYVRDDFTFYGFQILKAKSEDKSYYHLYWVRPWNTTHAFILEIGYKFKLGDESKDYVGESEYKKFKGFTFEIAPYKDIS